MYKVEILEADFKIETELKNLDSIIEDRITDLEKQIAILRKVKNVKVPTELPEDTVSTTLAIRENDIVHAYLYISRGH